MDESNDDEKAKFFLYLMKKEGHEQFILDISQFTNCFKVIVSNYIFIWGEMKDMSNSFLTPLKLLVASR